MKVTKQLIIITVLYKVTGLTLSLVSVTTAMLAEIQFDQILVIKHREQLKQHSVSMPQP